MNPELTLPLPAAAFLPHRPPMQLVDTLLCCGDHSGLAQATPGADCVLVDAAGFLDEVAFIELMAQGYAVIKGYQDRLQGAEPSQGYLVGVRTLKITGRARGGDSLLVRIETVGSFQGCAVAEGEIERAGEIVAAGTIKLWIGAPALPAGGVA